MSSWTAIVDQTSGKTYYANQTTGETTWTVPAELSGGQAPAPAAPSTEDIGEGWHKVLDPTTGKHYYANANTGETSWMPPSLKSDPHEFHKVFDPNSGRHYYVHKQTQAVQWDVPESYKQEEARATPNGDATTIGAPEPEAPVTPVTVTQPEEKPTQATPEDKPAETAPAPNTAESKPAESKSDKGDEKKDNTPPLTPVPNFPTPTTDAAGPSTPTPTATDAKKEDGKAEDKPAAGAKGGVASKFLEKAKAAGSEAPKKTVPGPPLTPGTPGTPGKKAINEKFAALMQNAQGNLKDPPPKHDVKKLPGTVGAKSFPGPPPTDPKKSVTLPTGSVDMKALQHNLAGMMGGGTAVSSPVKAPAKLAISTGTGTSTGPTINPLSPSNAGRVLVAPGHAPAKSITNHPATGTQAAVTQAPKVGVPGPVPVDKRQISNPGQSQGTAQPLPAGIQPVPVGPRNPSNTVTQPPVANTGGDKRHSGNAGAPTVVVTAPTPTQTAPTALSSPRPSVDTRNVGLGQPNHQHKPSQGGQTLQQPTHHHQPSQGQPAQHSPQMTERKLALPAPLREDIAKFQMEGFASQHFRAVKNKKEGKVNLDEILSYSKEPIKKSLLASAKKWNSEALALFKLVQSWMGEHKSSKAPDAIRKAVLAVGQDKEKLTLKDELFCQLCQQTRNNPDLASLTKGWQLMAMCCSAVAPTKDFEPFLMKYLAENYNHQQAVVRTFAPYCYWRVQLTIKDGPAENPLTVEDVTDMATRGVRPSTVQFGGSLEYIVHLERGLGSQQNVPALMPWLCSQVEKCGGFQTKGIFRIAAEKSEIAALTASIEAGNYEWKKPDPHVPADVLKHFLRELVEPVIPMGRYKDGLAASDSMAQCATFAKSLPKVHYDTLSWLLTWLNGLAKHQSVTAMSEENIGIVFAMDLMRSTETDPTQAFKNSSKEKNLVCNLLMAWKQGLQLK